ncbi:MAG: polysaccharide export protein, partial [Mesorhizobium sp.]
MAIQDVRRFLFGVLLCAAVPISFQAAAADYKLGPQDKVRIKVYEWPALSDDLAVGDDGTLALPLVGTLKADGISVADLAKENLREPPYVSVDILQYRPFYVLGDVQHPGEYAYRPGTRILTALSIAGGPYRVSDFQALRAERDAILSRGSLNIYEGKRRALLLRLARLKSETRELA